MLKHEDEDAGINEGAMSAFGIFRQLVRVQIVAINEQLADHEKRIRFIERTIGVAGGAVGLVMFAAKLFFGK